MYQISSLLGNKLPKILKRHVVCEYGLLCASYTYMSYAVNWFSQKYIHMYVRTYVRMLYLSAISIAGVLQCMDQFCDGSQPGNVTFPELTSANHLNTIVYTHVHKWISYVGLPCCHMTVLHCWAIYCPMLCIARVISTYIHTYVCMLTYLQPYIYCLYRGCSWVGLSTLSMSNVLTMLKCATLRSSHRTKCTLFTERSHIRMYVALAHVATKLALDPPLTVWRLLAVTHLHRHWQALLVLN